MAKYAKICLDKKQRFFKLLDKRDFSGCNMLPRAGEIWQDRHNWVLWLEKQNCLVLLTTNNAIRRPWVSLTAACKREWGSMPWTPDSHGSYSDLLHGIRILRKTEQTGRWPRKSLQPSSPEGKLWIFFMIALQLIPHLWRKTLVSATL